MNPVTYEIVSDVSAKYGLAIALIIGRCRARQLMLARIEIARRLWERGYTKAQIGRALRRDHSMVLFYLGEGKKRPAKPRWRRPHVRHVRWVKAPPLSKEMKAMRERYLVPYAGADMTEYVWRRRCA